MPSLNNWIKINSVDGYADITYAKTDVITTRDIITEINKLKEKNMKKNVLFLAPSPQYAKTVIENQAKALDRKKIPYNASTKFSDMYISTNEVHVEIVYTDPLKWTDGLFKHRDAVFGKKELLAQAHHKFFNCGFHTPNMSLSKYVIDNSTDYTVTEAPPTTYLPGVKNVYFNHPYTIVIWTDGTKTTVKCQDGDFYSPEAGLALCFTKKALGNMPNFNNIFRKWIPEEENVSEVAEGD